MTNEEIKKIKQLQMQGYGYKSIAIEVDLPVNTIKSYCRRHPVSQKTFIINKGFCQNCGEKIIPSLHCKEKKFCSDKCRVAWWTSHSKGSENKTQKKVVCAYCGKEFISYPSKRRKFCSRTCFANARRKGCGVDNGTL